MQFSRFNCPCKRIGVKTAAEACFCKHVFDDAFGTQCHDRGNLFPRFKACINCHKGYRLRWIPYDLPYFNMAAGLIHISHWA